ncbi:hypothetical protein [Streptomyces mutabilis]|uniref:hypothetical protein n=1 Tax=Streptomyces mutabilis TaxID=67332 RepID=UPI0034DE3F7D
MINPRHNTIDVTSAVCQVLIEARTDLVLVDEIHLLNHATTADEDLSDHLKYFTEHLPATFVYDGINVEKSGLFTGVAASSSGGRCILVRTGAFPPLCFPRSCKRIAGLRARHGCSPLSRA